MVRSDASTDALSKKCSAIMAARRALVLLAISVQK